MSEKRHNPENFSSSEAEITLLRSDLAELFQAQADKTELWTDDDWELPTEIVLAGVCRFTNDSGKHAIEVQVRQRLDDKGLDYLIIMSENGNDYWMQITDKGAWRLYKKKGEEPLGADDAAGARFFIRDSSTTWTIEEAKHWAMLGGLYEQADIRARRSQ